MKIYILEKTQVEQVSVMNKLLNDALRAKGYKGPEQSVHWKKYGILREKIIKF